MPRRFRWERSSRSGPFRRDWCHLGSEFAEGSCFAARQSLKQFPLALGQVVSSPITGHIAPLGRKRTHTSAGLLQEFRLGMPSPHAQLNQSLRAPPPTFHQPPPTEQLQQSRDFVGVKHDRASVLQGQPEWQSAITPDFSRWSS
jgi:hypothetical protein